MPVLRKVWRGMVGRRNPSGNRKGDGNPGGSGCPCPVRESLSRLSLAVGVESGVSSVCD